MNRRVSTSLSYRPLLRRAGILAAISLGLALALVLFLFGANDEFFSRLFRAFFVFFWLSSITFLGVVPFVGWATSHWFGKNWSGATVPLGRNARATSPPTTVRKPVRTVRGKK